MGFWQNFLKGFARDLSRSMLKAALDEVDRVSEEELDKIPDLSKQEREWMGKGIDLALERAQKYLDENL